jgi:hypothetical protein
VHEAVKAVGDCAVYQRSRFDEGQWVIETHLLDAEGDAVLASVPYSPGSDPQKMGSGITYARRYSLCAAFCLVAEEDDDGNAASEPKQPKINDRLVKAVEMVAEQQHVEVADLQGRIKARYNLGSKQGKEDALNILTAVYGGQVTLQEVL